MSDDSTLELLKSIDSRLARLENRMEETPKMALDGFAILGDSLDEKFNPHTEEGIGNLAKFEKVQKLMDLLQDKDTLDAIVTLTESLKDLGPLVEKVKLLEDGISMFADSFDEISEQAMAKGFEIEEFSNQLKKLSLLLINAFESGAFTNLLDSGILDPRAIETVGAVGRSMAVSSEARKVEVGPFRVLTSLMDRDIQRALGFLLTFATHFGRTLSEQKTKAIKA
ncbi:MAG: DUF1641 domain-containing protein [Deltaproteobacteria bacterium]|nr:MAG: DUF1641 domain-containing protein [Deltaproteobacteria bacterium]